MLGIDLHDAGISHWKVEDSILECRRGSAHLSGPAWRGDATGIEGGVGQTGEGRVPPPLRMRRIVVPGAILGLLPGREQTIDPPVNSQTPAPNAMSVRMVAGLHSPAPSAPLSEGKITSIKRPAGALG